MRNRKYKIIILSFILGLSAWIIDNVFDYYIFYKGHGFWELLILNMPPHETYIRSTILALFFVFGIYTNHYLSQIEEAEGRYHRLFDSVNDAIFLLSPVGGQLQGKILEANKVAREKMRYSKGELLQLSLTDPTVS